MCVQRSETAPEVCHSSEVLDDPIFSSHASILHPACVVKGEGTGDSTGLFPSMDQKSGHTHCQHTLAYFPYIPLCAYCHANCIPVKEEALAVLSLEKMNDNRNIKILWECIWYLPRPHPTTFAASRSVPVPQTGLCTSYFDPSKAVPGTQGA